MALFELTNDRLERVASTGFVREGIMERADLQRLFRDQLKVILPGAMVIAEEFGDWDDSRRRIDLLAIDRQANLVVIEFKRTADGGHMDLQAIRYAAMVSTMTFDEAVAAYQRYANLEHAEAMTQLLEFLEWNEPDEQAFGKDVRIVLVSQDFSKEMTTAVMWLNSRQLDISCIRLQPYTLKGQILINIEPIIPLPEAQDYLIQVRHKSVEVRQAFRENKGPTGYWFVNVGEMPGNSHRRWEDCHQYGFLQAGGGPSWRDQIKQLRTGDLLVAYLSGHGYVGVGRVTSEAIMQRDFTVQSHGKKLIELPLESQINATTLNDSESAEYCIGVEWFAAVERTQAVKDQFRRNTACRIHDAALVKRLLSHFRVTFDTPESSVPIA